MTPNQATLLIVDDEEDLRDAIAYDFKSKGYQVFTAENGLRALEVIEAHPEIALVLTDMRMPKMNGVELLKKIKAKDVFLPVVMFITGFSDTPLDEAFHLGADAVFPKPFDRDALFGAVARALVAMEERYQRKNIRVVSDLPVKIHFLKSNMQVDAKVLNIGRGGMFVSVKGFVPIPDETADFRLETEISLLPMISGQGIVRWVRREEKLGSPTGCGVEFENLDDECLSKVISLINFLKTGAYIPLS